MVAGDSLPTIDAGRVRLRGLRDADVPALYRIFSDPVAMRYWSSPPMSDPSAARALLEDIADCFDEGSLFQWGVTRIDSDAVIGTCTLASIDADNRRAEVGFMLDSSCWRRGYMTEAVTALIGYAFGPMDLTRLEADVDPRNRASLALLEKLGFRREGLLRERWRVGDEVTDSQMLGLLRRQWRPGDATSG